MYLVDICQPLDLKLIQAKLEVSDNGIPMLTSADWHEVIEKSHKHDNPFSHAHNTEEATQVSIVRWFFMYSMLPMLVQPTNYDLPTSNRAIE